MKPVTVETVRARIEQIGHAINTMPGGFTLSINHQFELSCLQELLALLESRTVTVSKSDIFNVPGGETYAGGEMISVDTLCLYLAEHGIKWEAE